MRIVQTALLFALTTAFGCSSDLDEGDIPDYRDPKSEFGPPTATPRNTPKADDAAAPPKIVRVRWQSADDCRTDTISPVQFAIELDDANEQSTELIFDGAVSGCDSAANRFGSMINGPRVQLSCHHVSTHRVFLTVVDHQGRGDSLAFQFGPCSRGVIDTP